MTNLRTGSTRARLTALVALALALGVARADAEAPTDFKVVVNGQNQTQSVGPKYLADLFLKRATRWPDGSVADPVDQLPSSAVRRRFDEDVLGRSVSAVRNAWQEAIFSGRDVPPPELPGDEAVVEYVASHPGAVGYVSPATPLPAGVRVLAVR